MNNVKANKTAHKEAVRDLRYTCMQTTLEHEIKCTYTVFLCFRVQPCLFPVPWSFIRVLSQRKHAICDIQLENVDNCLFLDVCFVLITASQVQTSSSAHALTILLSKYGILLVVKKKGHLLVNEFSLNVQFRT